MEASRPEAVLVEREASRVAKEAAEALRESRREARRNNISTPTWTGRHGGPPRFGSSDRPNAVGSESLLERMRYRQALDGTSSSGSSNIHSQRVQTSAIPQSHVLIRQIREFLAQNGGVAKSKEIVARFPDIKGAEAITEFRKMVRQIADFKDSQWTLKEEYA